MNGSGSARRCLCVLIILIHFSIAIKILKFRYSSKAPKVNKASCNKDNNNNSARWDMEEIKSNVALLLEGKPYEEMHEFCDFTLEEQNELQVAKGVHPSAPDQFKPVIKKNVSYIVAAVLINDQGEVLMMQEAKSSCAGQWYLPAGRMEPGEDIAEAAQREVLEETGLHFQLSTLLMVESAGKKLRKCRQMPRRRRVH